MCKRSSIRLAVDVSSETMEAKRQCDDIFKVLEKKTTNYFYYLAKLACNTEGEIETFPGKQILRELITSRPMLQDANGRPQAEMKEH